ncbi:HD domain-containing protein [Rickettsia tamurae]|uniref:HD domain-containing protein n=1 Tax=Rickettsia tamurae TaxID=334545 RepID=UPI00068AFB02
MVRILYQQNKKDLLLIKLCDRSILHNCIEDTELTKEIIAKEFGNKIANQVEDLTRIKQDRKISSAKMVRILYQQNKKDLLLIKLCDRLHNINNQS